MTLKLKPDNLVMAGAVLIGLFIVMRSRKATARPAAQVSSVGTGSPENIYSGRTLAANEASQAAARVQLARDLQGAGDFWI